MLRSLKSFMIAGIIAGATMPVYAEQPSVPIAAIPTSLLISDIDPACHQDLGTVLMYNDVLNYVVMDTYILGDVIVFDIGDEESRWRMVPDRAAGDAVPDGEWWIAMMISEVQESYALLAQSRAEGVNLLKLLGVIIETTGECRIFGFNGDFMGDHDWAMGLQSFHFEDN